MDCGSSKSCCTPCELKLEAQDFSVDYNYNKLVVKRCVMCLCARALQGARATVCVFVSEGPIKTLLQKVNLGSQFIFINDQHLLNAYSDSDQHFLSVSKRR